MIPSEYRLERVAAGLIERLDGARRSFSDADSARDGFARVANEHIEGVLAEWRDLPFVPEGDRHAEFVRREIQETFLPRFAADAVAMTVAERSGYGLGAIASPAGRVSLVVLALMMLGVLARFEYNPAVWLLTAMDLALPFLPDILGRMQQRRYETSLRELVGDMKRIQDQAARYNAPAIADPTGTEALARREAARRASQEAKHGG